MDKFNILVAEDSLTLANVIKHKIEEEIKGSKAIIAKSFEDAIYHIEESGVKFSIALSGVNMPDDPDGDVVRYLVKKNLPVIVMTRTLNREDRERFLSESILDYVLTEKIEDMEYSLKLIKKIKNNSNIDILVVDDSRTSRFMIEALLKNRNFKVLEAKDGVQALNIINSNSHNIKLVITDYNMPRMDGFDLVSNIRLRYNREQMGVVGISGSDDDKLIIKFLKNGANDFLVKPFTEQEFYCRVEQSIDNILNIEAISDMANRDFLTQMYNRRYFFQKGEALFKRAKNLDKKLCVAMLDIDHFKKVNDTFGHDIGDIVIKKLAQTILEKFDKKGIIPARFGGEEFAILFATDDIKKPFLALENLRRVVNQISVKAGKERELKFSISIGLSDKMGESFDEFLKNADELLYQAKEDGRNRVIIQN